MTYLMYMLMMNTISFMFMSHPLSMGLNLLIQTTLIAMITGTLTLNFWFSYMLFMIMVGGMLVLFMYMTSITSNEKFKFKPSLIPFMMVSLIIMNLMNNNMINYSESNIMKSQLMNINLMLSKFLEFPNKWIYLMIITYLLITLIAIVKITNIKHGPLRQSK